jgi:hypothetical protein
VDQYTHTRSGTATKVGLPAIINMKSDIDFLRGRGADGLKAWIDYGPPQSTAGVMQAVHAVETDASGAAAAGTP